MRRKRTILVSVLVATAALLPGCYTRVVDSRGIGADSEKLRDEHEREPLLRDALTTSKERESKPPSGVW